MAKVLRPFATSEDVLRRGTDFDFMGRFRQTLEYNHFTQEDLLRLEEIARLLSDSREEAEKILLSFFKQLEIRKSSEFPKSKVHNYLQTFFYAKRDDEYVDEIIDFFNELKERNYNVSKLIVAFNQLQFFLATKLLSKKGFTPNACLKLLETLRRSMNIELQVLIEVYTEKIIEEAAIGISSLMDKNAEIMFIRDLLKKLELQNAEAQNVSAATEEMTASIVDVADNASSVAERSDNAVQKADQGRIVINQALDEIIHTDTTFDNIVKNFNQLQEYITTIQDVVQLIHGIADQTNLLALNASIEAARAGEHGRGFSVVATEVRKLAENTVSSLNQVQENVGKLGVFSQDVSKAIEETSFVIKRGVEQAGEAVPILQGIVEDVEKISDATSNTAASAEQQAAAVDDIAQRMAAITDLSNEVQTLGYDTGEAVFGLSQLTEEFRNNMFSYNITLSTKSLLLLSKTDHILWKWRIYNMLLGLENVRADEITTHEECQLGKWYSDEQTIERVGEFEGYRMIHQPHRAVHDHARRAAEAYERGNIEEAENQLALLDKKSDEVLEAIDLIIRELAREKR